MLRRVGSSTFRYLLKRKKNAELLAINYLSGRETRRLLPLVAKLFTIAQESVGGFFDMKQSVVVGRCQAYSIWQSTVCAETL